MGMKNSKRRLTTREQLALLVLYQENVVNQVDIAEYFGVSKTAVCNQFRKFESEKYERKSKREIINSILEEYKDLCKEPA